MTNQNTDHPDQQTISFETWDKYDRVHIDVIKLEVFDTDPYLLASMEGLRFKLLSNISPTMTIEEVILRWNSQMWTSNKRKKGVYKMYKFQTHTKWSNLLPIPNL